MLFFVGIKKRPTEALFMAYKKSIVCKNLEWKAGLASKKVFSFQSQLAATEN
jgi:hypothetical protein